MYGRFIFPTCHSLGLEASCYVRNTERDGAHSDILNFEVTIFQDGKALHQKSDFVALKMAEFFELNAQSLGFDFDKSKDYMIQVDCWVGDKTDKKYFPQEHHITYTDIKTGKRASILYDQQPYFPNKDKFSDVVVLAPKVWIGKKQNSYVCFVNARDVKDQTQQINPMQINILSEDGEIVASHKENIKFNSGYIFNCKTALKNQPIEENSFYSLVAKGGESTFAMLTIIKDEESGNIAIEHSLPPMYYVDGDLKRVREDALKFEAA